MSAAKIRAKIRAKFRKRRAAFMRKRRWIDEETHSTGVGPLSLDVAMARRHGWSEKQINRVAEQIGVLSRRNAAISHRNGPVPACPCVVCDPMVPDSQTDNVKRRESWRQRGLWRGPRT